MKQPFYLYLKKTASSSIYYYMLTEASCLNQEILLQHHRKSTGKKKKREAELFCINLIQDLLHKTVHQPIQLIFGDYAKVFYTKDCPRLARMALEGKELSPGTLIVNQKLLKRYILSDSTICSITLSSFKKNDLINYSIRLTKSFGFTRQTQMVYDLFKVILREAYFTDLLDKDPTKGLGKLKYDKQERGSLEIDEIELLLKRESYQSLSSYAVFATALLLGLRRSELRILQWYQIDFNHDLVIIDRALKKDGTIGLPKNGHTRTMPLPAPLKIILKEWYHHGAIPMPHKNVFTNEAILSDKWLTKEFDIIRHRYIKQATERFITFHSLRHSFATYFSYKGIDDRTIKAIGGWIDDKMVDNYRHYTNIQMGEIGRSISF